MSNKLGLGVSLGLCVGLLAGVPLACGGSDSDKKDSTGGSGGDTGSGAAGTGGVSTGGGGSSGMAGTSGSAGRGGTAGGSSAGSSGSSAGAGGGAGGSSSAGGTAGGSGGARDGGTADAPRATDGAAATGKMSFFITSTGSGMVGGNLGGIEAADAKCKMLAEAAGTAGRTWKAYISSSKENAKDRIGKGPWYNAKGEMLAASVEALHPTINAEMMRAAYIMARPDLKLMLDEKGGTVPGNQHDILTGSKADGTVIANATCMDWTSNAAAMNAQVGHTDLPAMFSASWNSAHTANCSAMGLMMVGGAGRLYCFATD
jgi:hypothetical protein